MTDNLPTAPADQPPDAPDLPAQVAVAVAALRAFGREDMTRAIAARLLPWWRGYANLTAAQRQAVLAQFPDSRRPVTS